MEQIRGFVAHQKRLLETERLAVTKQELMELRELGEIVEVEVKEINPTSYGGLILKMEKMKGNAKAPNFKGGESIALDPGDDSELLSGILKKVFLNIYEVAVSESLEVFKQRRKWVLVKQTDDTSFKQMEEALEEIPRNPSPLRDVLLGLQAPTSAPTGEGNDQSLRYENPSLDNSQKRSVKFAMEQRELAVIHGPPGTGKTTTLVEIVHQAVRRKEKVLVTAASHVAVDNIAEKLADGGLNIIRIGHPARVTSELVLRHSLDVKIGRQLEIVRDLKYELDSIKQRLHAGMDGRVPFMTAETQAQALRILLEKEKAKLRKLKEREILTADVVLGTLIGCGSALKFLNKSPHQHFQLTMIDECGQSLEMACWIVIPRSPKLILAGDHKQLPPTVITKTAPASAELSKSLMERVLEEKFYNEYGKMLQIQYRMNRLIMNWSSTNFYMSKLWASEQVADHKLSGLPRVAAGPLTNTVLRLVDTKGKQLRECSSTSRCTPSYANLGEAAIVKDYVEKLVKEGVTPDQIAIISPYKAQVNVLEANLLKSYPKLEIRSVDGFQGREKEVVILSMVRSNENESLGFLVEKRRLNVGVTRARRQLVLICDSSTVSHDEFLGNFIHYMRENGEVDEAPVLDTKLLVLPWRDFISSFYHPKPDVKNPPNISKQSGHQLPSLDRVVGMDCEMVGAGEGGAESVLARVSIVDGDGEKILDKYVSAEEEITDYRTEFSGIRPENMIGASRFSTVRKEVLTVLKEKIIVGHGLSHDFEVLNYFPPRNSIRDTATFRGFNKKGKTPSLKTLAMEVLGLTIQTGEHDSLEDARTAVMLYRKVREDWEGLVQSKKNRCYYGPSVESKIERLKKLTPTHEFQDLDFTAILRNRNMSVLCFIRGKTEMEWAQVWLPIRQDRQESPYYYHGMSIMEAFNCLSNAQLCLWLHHREQKFYH